MRCANCGEPIHPNIRDYPPYENVGADRLDYVCIEGGPHVIEEPPC